MTAQIQSLINILLELYPDRQTFNLNCSIAKRMSTRFGESETEAMIRGAHILGYRDLRMLYAGDGECRRNAQAAYWGSLNRRPE